MVNTLVNYSEYIGQIPFGVDRANADRSIQNGPIYDPKRVLDIANRGAEFVRPSTYRCHLDMEDMDFDLDDVANLVVSALTVGSYIGSEWCQITDPPGHWAACDAYKVARSIYDEKQSTFKNKKYYLKFAIGRSGQILLIVSCHISNRKKR